MECMVQSFRQKAVDICGRSHCRVTASKRGLHETGLANREGFTMEIQ
jgi:hypothetical protein